MFYAALGESGHGRVTISSLEYESAFLLSSCDIDFVVLSQNPGVPFVAFARPRLAQKVAHA